MPGQPGNRNWGSVDSAHKQPFQHNFVKLGISTTGQVTVKLKITFSLLNESSLIEETYLNQKT